jgi:hypothetical protein
MLSDGDINPGMALIMGAQTNDSNKELFPAFLKKDGSLRALPTDAYLESLNLLVPKNNEHLFRDVLKMYPSHNDNPKDPVLGGSVSNLRNLGSATTDIMLCGARRRLSMINKRYPGKAFMYRFNYWYQSNKNCTAEPNYHSAQFGSQHEDEVTFVMGQPNFMQGGSCCGVFGDHTDSTAHPNISACPLDPQCAACYAPEKFDPHNEGGYTPYFNSTEGAFAEAVGQFWTNFASSQNPNVRAQAGEGGQEGAGDDGVWPGDPTGAALHQNIVLDASIGAPHYAAAEDTIHGNPEICALWDKVNAAHTQAWTMSESGALYEEGSDGQLAADAPMDLQSRNLLIARMVDLAGASE